MAIEAERRRIDDLNVYPVPDGDTGTNLALTVAAVVEGLESSEGEERDSLAHQASRAALMGARGNSGVIFSQIVRGAAESLRASDDLAAALRAGSDAAYRAVRTPVEGTMLTAIRALAEEAERGGDLEALLARGDACVAATREMLPVLSEAGVVDAGAAGLVEIVRGIAAVLAGSAARPARRRERRPRSGSRRTTRSPPATAIAPSSSSRAKGSTPKRSSAHSSRSATRCSSSATLPPSRCTCTPTTPAPRFRSGSPPGRSRGSRSPTCTPRRLGARAAAAASGTGGTARGRRRARRRGGRGRKPAPVREPRRGRRRRRADDEPLLCRDRRGARRHRRPPRCCCSRTTPTS